MMRVRSAFLSAPFTSSGTFHCSEGQGLLNCPMSPAFSLILF